MTNMTRRISIPLAAALALTACNNDSSSPTGPSEAPGLSPERADGRNVSIMTRNLYIGFDADLAIGALATGDPAIFGPVLQASIVTLQKTDFPTRARTFARPLLGWPTDAYWPPMPLPISPWPAYRRCMLSIAWRSGTPPSCPFSQRLKKSLALREFSVNTGEFG